ncbi:hypothetical protein NL676_036907 [Syzygium grande]|nr:hypothetical protein NL676_036907 [Syzygium grande]
MAQGMCHPRLSFTASDNMSLATAVAATTRAAPRQRCRVPRAPKAFSRSSRKHRAPTTTFQSPGHQSVRYQDGSSRTLRTAVLVWRLHKKSTILSSSPIEVCQIDNHAYRRACDRPTGAERGPQSTAQTDFSVSEPQRQTQFPSEQIRHRSTADNNKEFTKPEPAQLVPWFAAHAAGTVTVAASKPAVDTLPSFLYMFRAESL